MRSALFAFLALALSAQSVLAADELPADLMARETTSVLRPLGAWNIDYGENRCRLSRLFGTQDAPHLLYIEQSAPSPFFTLALAGPEFAKVQRYSVMKLGMAEDQIARELTGLSADFGKVGRGVIKKGTRLREPAPPAAGEAVWLTARLDPKEGAALKRILLARSDRTVVFETGPLGAAAEAMNACTTELLTDWGLDPAKHKQYRPPRVQNGENVARRIFNAFPRRTSLIAELGDSRARLIVEADGSVSQCVIDGLAASESLKPELCRFLREARFEPAQDSGGQPMRTFAIIPLSLQGL